MIIKKSIKPNSSKCDCCNKVFTNTIMKHYEIGAFKSFTLCKECDRQLKNVTNVDTLKKVISIDNNIYY